MVIRDEILGNERIIISTEMEGGGGRGRDRTVGGGGSHGAEGGAEAASNLEEEQRLSEKRAGKLKLAAAAQSEMKWSVAGLICACVRVQQDSHLVIIIRLGRLISHPYTATTHNPSLHAEAKQLERVGGEGTYVIGDCRNG